MDPKAFYRSLSEDLASEIQEARRKDIQWSVIRGVAGVGAFVSFYLSLTTSMSALAWVGSILVLVFALALKRHQAVRERLSFLKAKQKITALEEAYLNGDLSSLDSDTEFRDENHSYANDLDVFGPGSLYQRLSRAKTLGGKSKMQSSLKNLSWERLKDRQGAVSELSRTQLFMLDWRASLEGVENLNIRPGLSSWLGTESSVPWSYRSLVIWPFSFVVPIGFIVIAITGAWSYLSLVGYAFVLNLILMGAGATYLKRQYQGLDRVHKSLKVYADLIQRFKAFSPESTSLREVHERLFEGEVKAHEEIQRLGDILGRLDTMNNVMGLIILNGTFLFHLHVVRSLARWKQDNGRRLLEWLEIIEELEVWISKGTYAFHHPDFTYPQLVDETGLRAESIGHPFLRSDRRVDNPIDFSEHRLKVLTGSNMAGKSTFLRSLGLNVVLAANALPTCATDFRLSPFQLLTSMKPQDSINEDRSYFQAEVLRLRMILDRMQDGVVPSLVLFDEILRGTNSEDKRNGTMAFLKRLEPMNLRGVIATHDIEIAEISSGSETFKNFYFESTYKDGELHFDYKLREGVCQTPNATMLLKNFGVI